MNDGMIEFVIDTVASQTISIRAPNKIAIVGEGGDKTNGSVSLNIFMDDGNI